jgi:hypothetical protein
MKARVALGGAVVLMLAAVSPLLAVDPAGAEHNAGELQTSVDLGLGFKFGREGFTLDGRGDGPGGPWGLRLDGRVRPEGFSLDGWIRDAEKGYDFRLDGSLRATPGL